MRHPGHDTVYRVKKALARLEQPEKLNGFPNIAPSVCGLGADYYRQAARS